LRIFELAMLMALQAVHKSNDESNFIYDNSAAPAYRVWVEGTTHISYTDMVLYGPLLQKVGISGSIDAYRMLDITAQYSRAFFDKHLMGRPAPLLDGPTTTYPEVSFYSRNN